MKRKAKTVKSSLKNLIVIAVLAVSLVIGIITAFLFSYFIKKNYRKMADTATAHLREAVQKGGDVWKYDEATGIVTCGNYVLSVELFDSIQAENKNVFHTIFVGDTRVLTNIKDKEGNYAVGTQADAKIYAAVMSGKTYTKNRVKIFGTQYTVSYMPIFNGDEFFGMMFTGINESAVNATIFQSLFVITIGVIITMIVILSFSSRYLKNLLAKVSDNLNTGYDSLENFSAAVRSISDRTSSEVSDITTAMDSVAEGAMKQASETQQAMASTQEFAANIDVVNSEIQDSYDFITTIRSCVNDSEESINTLNDSINSNTQIIEDMSERIKDGVNSTKNAELIVNTIDNIALQISILALNASVEASHAGQFGRGFAVVADEIKKLATDSAESAKQTADIISEIVTTMNKANESNNMLVRSGNEQLKKSDDVINKMSILKDGVSEISLKLDTIKDKSDSLSHVKESLNKIITDLSSNSEQNAAVAEEVCASSTTVNNDVADLTMRLNEISNICDDLKNLVNYFG